MHTFKRQTYSGQVVEFIKRCILDGELAPGEQVKEVILSARACFVELLYYLPRFVL